MARRPTTTPRTAEAAVPARIASSGGRPHTLAAWAAGFSRDDVAIVTDDTRSRLVTITAIDPESRQLSWDALPNFADFDVASTPNESAIAVAKDSEDFLEEVNDILDEMEDSGKIEELIRTNIEIMDEHTGV